MPNTVRLKDTRKMFLRTFSKTYNMYMSPEKVKSAGGLYRWFMFSNLFKNCNSSLGALYITTTNITIRVPCDMPLGEWFQTFRGNVVPSL